VPRQTTFALFRRQGHSNGQSVRTPPTYGCRRKGRKPISRDFYTAHNTVSVAAGIDSGESLIHSYESTLDGIGLERGLVVSDVVRFVVQSTRRRGPQILDQSPQPVSLIEKSALLLPLES
jgi:hypothetical protein